MEIKSRNDFQNFKALIVVAIIVILLNTTLFATTSVPTAAEFEGQTNPSLVFADGQTKPTTYICTLITGDVLEVAKWEDGRYTIAIVSNRTAVQIISDGEDTYVIPAGIERWLGDKLDMQLFNIDYLIENGYCEPKMTTIPVIIEYSTNPGRKHAKINMAPGMLKKQDFKAAYASSADIIKEDAAEFADFALTEEGLEGVKKIWLDQKVKLYLDESVPGIGAPYAWDQGYNGTGVKIAILDTGIWKDHPDLTGKVIAEKDFTDDMTTEDLFGHGTHCAGIAAANGALKGVAPGALLINAKVLNKEGVGQVSWVMAAWEWAAEQGANVFSMSFGGAPTDGTAPWDIALNTIVDNYNIVVVAAAGNRYTYYTIESPAAADKAIAVGATTKPGIPKLSVISPEVKDIQANLMEYSPKPPVEGIQKPIVYAGLGSVEEFAKVDVAGKVALIQRGQYTFKEKVQNAANAGALAAIIFNNVPGNFFGTLAEPGMIPAVSISQEDGNYLLSLLEKGEVIVNLKWDPTAVDMAVFSSKGPRLDNAVKPEIVAPGVLIKSTVPTYECSLGDPSGYRVLSGTSMATPHVAGAAALLLQKHPDWKWWQVRDALISTADILPKYDIYTQGSGLVAVKSAIDAKVVFEPAVINLGTIGEPWLVQSKSFAIRNYGDEEVILELRVEKVHDTAGNTFDIATLDKYTVTIPAGESETVTLSVDLATAPINTPLGGRIFAKNTKNGEETHAIFGINKEKKFELKIKLINPERGLAKLLVISPEVKDIQANIPEYSPKPPVEGIQKPIVYAGPGYPWLPLPDVAGKIALIQNDFYPLRYKVENLANAGAVAVIAYNVPPYYYDTLFYPGIEIPVVTISLEDGTHLLDLLGKGEVIVDLRWETSDIAFPWRNALVMIADARSIKGFSNLIRTDTNGEVSVKVPPNNYYNVIAANAWTIGLKWPDWPVYWLEAIEIPMFEDKTVILDAREAKPVTLNMKVEQTDPSQTMTDMFYKRLDETYHGWAWGTNTNRLKNYMLPVASSIGELNTFFRFVEIRHTPEYEAMASKWLYLPTEKSPVVYDFFYTMLGEITVPMVYTVDNTTLEQMAMIKAKHFSTDINPREHLYWRFAFPTEYYIPFVAAIDRPYLVPIVRNEYLTPNKASYMQFVAPSTYYFDGIPSLSRSLYWPFIRFREKEWTIYRTGERLEKTWLEQPIKPWTTSATRTGNAIKISLGLGGFEAMDADGNIADASYVPYGMTFKTEVYKNNVLIWEYPNNYYWEQEVTPEEANYRIELYSKNVPTTALYATPPFKPYWGNYSTETFTTIKFKSKYVEGTEALPIINLNYKVPALRMNNVRVVSRKDPLIIHIIPQSLKGLNISQVRFWYSYDDGATWTEVSKVVRGTNEWIIKLGYQQEGYISIKTWVIDTDGNSVEQTIMRAFYVTTSPKTSGST